MTALEERIKEAQDAYYNGEPIMEDDEFDRLWDKLQREQPNSELLKIVGADSSDGFKKAEHMMPMGSQQKANTAAQMNDFFKNDVEYTVSWKYDGISLEMQYVDGVFIKAVTRGNGTVGDDVTANVKKMKGVPKKLGDSFTGAVRGEILLLHDDQKKYFPDAKNCRNMASGIAKRKDGADCDKLTVISYDAKCHDSKKDWSRQSLVEAWLKSNGFIIIDLGLRPKTWTGEEAVALLAEKWGKKNIVPFDFDGLVFKQEKIDWADLEKNARPKTQIALKPARSSAETTITGIRWSMKNGTLTPVLQFSPVHLDGTTVQQANAYNVRWLEDMGIEVGHHIEVVKSGLIIPRVVRDFDSGRCTAEYSEAV